MLILCLRTGLNRQYSHTAQFSRFRISCIITNSNVFLTIYFLIKSLELGSARQAKQKAYSFHGMEKGQRVFTRTNLE